MIINLSQKAILPLRTSGSANFYKDSGKTITPPDGYIGWKNFYISRINGSTESAEFGTSDYTITPSGGADVIRNITVSGIKTEPLSLDITEESQTFTPTSPNVGYSSVTVPAATKTALFPKPMEEDFTYKPNAGDYGIGSLSLSAARLQEKTITPGEQAISVKPDSGCYGMSKVTVKGGSSIKQAYYIFSGDGSRSFSAPTDVIIKNPTNIIIMNTTAYDSREAIDTVLLTAMIGQSSSVIYGDDGEYFTQYGRSYSISDISYYSGATSTYFTFPWTSKDHATGHLYGLYFQDGVQYFVAIYGT